MYILNDPFRHRPQYFRGERDGGLEERGNRNEGEEVGP